MNKGLFIVFEGPDGSGKSTIIQNLSNYLSEQKYLFKIFTTREPGGKNNIIAEDIRNILLNKVEYKISDQTEALLFAASRAQHVHDFIEPHLNNGDLIICDRYIMSSIVYQGIARNIGVDNIYDINRFAINGILPNLTIVLMIHPEVGINRIKSNQLREFNRLDKEKTDLHRKVYDGYRKLIDENKDGTIVEVDASKSISEVLEEVKKIVLEKIKDVYGK